MATGQNGIPGPHAVKHAAMEPNSEIVVAQIHHHPTVD